MKPARPSSEGTGSEERLFANRDYIRLFAAQVSSLLGSGVTSVALAVFAYQLTGSDATVVVGTALTLRILAFVLLSPIAGVLADRVDRKRMLVTADLLRFGLLGFFPFITTVWQIYALIFAINAVTAFFTPTYEASLPEVVGPTLYTRALSASRVAVDVEGAVGPLVAGALIAAVGVRWTFWFDAATYLLSALLVLGARVPRPVRPEGPFPWRSFLPEVSFGTRVLFREPALRRALLLHFAEAAAGRSRSCRTDSRAPLPCRGCKVERWTAPSTSSSARTAPCTSRTTAWCGSTCRSPSRASRRTPRWRGPERSGEWRRRGCGGGRCSRSGCGRSPAPGPNRR